MQDPKCVFGTEPRARSTFYFPCFYDSVCTLWVDSHHKCSSRVCATWISIIHIQSVLYYLLCFPLVDVGAKIIKSSLCFGQLNTAPLSVTILALKQLDEDTLVSTWTPVRLTLRVRCWPAVPSPPPPWLQNAGCPRVPTAWSTEDGFPLIPAVFVLSSSWTCCSLSISWRRWMWWLEQISVTWGWWVVNPSSACDSPGLLDKMLPSLRFHFLVCEWGHTNSPSAELDYILPLKYLNIPQ